MIKSRKRPETLRLRTIVPALTVGDMAESLRWYCDVVGFFRKETWEHEGRIVGAELVAGSHRILLMQDDWAKGRDRPKGVGMRLHLETSQDIDDIADAIRDRGGTLASEPEDKPWGTRSFDLTDPDGFNLTISAPYS
ncbi:MAG: VOC family protein [Gemmatimonadales bacterium]|jgi:uncharacterized glyoxalase superfamily protein PhnB|nr:MAG: VOC family protein [Gemmatimonadales bacterium]